MNRCFLLLFGFFLFSFLSAEAQSPTKKSKGNDGLAENFKKKKKTFTDTIIYGSGKGSMKISDNPRRSRKFIGRIYKKGRVFHICVANNNYNQIQYPDFDNAYPKNAAPHVFIQEGNLQLPSLDGTLNDAKHLAQKLRFDYLRKSYTLGAETNSSMDSALDGKVFTYELWNEQATLKNIKSSFKKVINLAEPDDIFIFSFSGIGFAVDESETILIPFIPKGNTTQDFKNSILTVSQLCAWVKQIPCKQQLIVSDACHAAQLALPVMNNLFDTKRIVNEQRNLAILSAQGVAYERRLGPDRKVFGELSYSLLQAKNILKSMQRNNYDGLFAEIKSAEEKKKNATKAKLYTEQDFRQYQKVIGDENGMRGAIAEETIQKVNTTEESKTYALVVSSNQYKKGNGWKNLKNPSNDANAIAKLLKTRYGAEVIRINNPKDKIFMLDMIDSVKRLADKNDKLLVFFAGHGGYHKDDMTGYIVLKESQSLKEDKHLQSYLTFSDIRNKIGLSKARNVMVILDVCFGGNFDTETQTVSMSTYRDSELSIPKLVERANKERSRIFLAAGEYEVPDYWKKGEKHSPFAEKLIKALTEEKDFTCPGRMYEFLKGNITKPILKPFYGHKADGDFLVEVR